MLDEILKRIDELERRNVDSDHYSKMASIFLWLKDRRVRKAHFDYPDYFYLFLPDPSLHVEIFSTLEDLYCVEECEINAIYSSLKGFRIYALLDVAEKIEKQAKDAKLFNVDVRPEQKRIVEKGIFQDVRVPADIAREFPMTMITGMWGLVELEYSPETAKKDSNGNLLENPLIVVDFKPFQSPEKDPRVLKEARSKFTLEEWLDVLINTIGYNHNVYRDVRRKIGLLSRLLPVVEENLHIAEFGPKATGKTYIFRNVSRYSRIIVGGMITPAALFYNLRTGMPGELAVRDCVVFDEISKVKFPNPDEVVAKLKDFMESAQYERGKQRVTSGASIVILGNVEVEDRGGAYVLVEDLTYILPKPMRDSAFIDRIRGIVPGWELPKIGQSKYHLSQGYGIALDYFSEALHELRKENLIGE